MTPKTTTIATACAEHLAQHWADTPCERLHRRQLFLTAALLGREGVTDPDVILHVVNGLRGLGVLPIWEEAA